MREEFELLHDVTTPEGSLREARDLAERVIQAHVPQTRTRERAIQSLSKRYGLGSWLLRLLRGDKVMDRRHLIKRLERALVEASRLQRARADADEALAEAIRRRDEAVVGGRLVVLEGHGAKGPRRPARLAGAR